MAYRASKTEIMVAFAEHSTIIESRSCSVKHRGKIGVPSMATDHITSGRTYSVPPAVLSRRK